MKYLILLFLIFITKLPVCQKYQYISDSISKQSFLKIEKSNLNKYIDTSEFIYTGAHILPDEYKIQNLKNGIYYQYFLQDTNKVAFELTYKKQYLTAFKSYWFNDTLKDIGQLLNGINYGTWLGYNSDGKIVLKFIMTNGFHHEFYFYYSNGNVKTHHKEIEIGNGKYRLWEVEDFFENGKLMEKGVAKNGFKTGEWKYYNNDGTLKEIKKHKYSEYLDDF